MHGNYNHMLAGEKGKGKIKCHTDKKKGGKDSGIKRDK